jgi:hypothetical protein
MLRNVSDYAKSIWLRNDEAFGERHGSRLGFVSRYPACDQLFPRERE